MYRKSRGPEVTWTGSHVDRKSRGPEVTRTGSHVARDITEDGRDVKRGALIKDNNGRLITESKEV